EGARYTLAMLDPDAPSAAQMTSSQFRHWVVRSCCSKNRGGRSGVHRYSVHPIPFKLTTRLELLGKLSTDWRLAFVLFREPPDPWTHRSARGAPRCGGSTEAPRRWDAVRFGERHGLQMVGAVFYLVRGQE
ncbi:hypothetical protein FB451DRAFT_1065201, partial [Mycena latifolia]